MIAVNFTLLFTKSIKPLILFQVYDMMIYAPTKLESELRMYFTCANTSPNLKIFLTWGLNCGVSFCDLSQLMRSLGQLVGTIGEIRYVAYTVLSVCDFIGSL